MTHPANEIELTVEAQLSLVLKFECDFHETLERLKNELESTKGYSTKKLFKMIDKKNRGFIDVSSLREFIYGTETLKSKGKNTKQVSLQHKRLISLLRRLISSTDGKITFTEFANVIKPVDLRPYLKRIRKYTKGEKKQVSQVQRQMFTTRFKQGQVDLRKPLTAFQASEIMLNRDPERHVKLMPARYGTHNELAESGPISAFNQKYENHMSVVSESTRKGDGRIGQEARMLLAHSALSNE